MTGQAWLYLLAAALLAVGAWLLRGIGLAGFLLLSSSATVFALITWRWPIKLVFEADYLAWLRNAAIHSIVGVSQEAKALVLGMAIGDTSLVSPDLKSSLQLTSLTHLMAVSGANCAIVIGAFFLITFRLGIKWRIAISFFGLIAYVQLVGAQPSVSRAAFMALCVMFATLMGRRVAPLAALAFSVLSLLSFWPGLASELGFALSVLATAGILILAPKLYQKMNPRVPRWLAVAISVSAGAQIFCFPILLALQGGIPTYSVISNLLAEPLVPPITVLGLLGVLSSPLPVVGTLFFYLASIPAWCVALIANTFSSLPFATMPWRVDALGVIAAVVLVVALLFVYSKSPLVTRNVAGVVAVSLLAICLGAVLDQAIKLSLWPVDNWQVASCDVGQGDATVLRQSGRIAVIDVGRDEKKIDNCLNQLGVKHVDLLVLTHFDADHVAGLPGALNKRTVSLAMLTSYKDDRPGADFSRFQLEAQHIPVVKAQTNLSGNLGSATWQVLSPSRTGEEAEDANDGSITMLWKFPHFKVITLADLGEKGQQRLASDLEKWWQPDGSCLIMKVSHHGSADQYPEFLEHLAPCYSLISVGKNNGYGHPTARTLRVLARAGSALLRTDQLGSIAIAEQKGQFQLSYSGSS